VNSSAVGGVCVAVECGGRRGVDDGALAHGVVELHVLESFLIRGGRDVPTHLSSEKWCTGASRRLFEDYSFCLTES
jgi:hypothetical protein